VIDLIDLSSQREEVDWSGNVRNMKLTRRISFDSLSEKIGSAQEEG
jgi:hypothetical protein